MDPGTLSARWGSSRLSSSSLPRQGWPRLSPSYAPTASDAGPSYHASGRNYDSAVDESCRTYLPTALRQPNEHTQPPSRKERSTNPVSERPSTTPSQPVLVRAYSGKAEDTTNKLSTMSPRRLFPFTGSRSSVSSRSPGPPLPTDKDFSIENILQAIEPDVRVTLDSIAEICGRSKLSLANEYDSHIAPLGEIRAPPGGLIPVEEASPSDERCADEGVVVFDDDQGLMDAGRDLHPFSFYRYLENLRQAASALERNGASGSRVPAQPNAARSDVVNAHLDAASETDVGSLRATREFSSKPKNSGRDLLAKTVVSSQIDHQSQAIVTPAVVSEVHFDAQAEDSHVDAEPSPLSTNPCATPDTRAPEIVRSLLGWLRWTARVTEPDSRPALESAESRLRAMLERSSEGSSCSQAV